MKFNKETAKLNGQKSKRGLSKTNQELRDIFQNVIEANEKNIGIWLNEAAEQSPIKALELLLKISSFIMSKPKSISVNLEEQKDDMSSLTDEELNERLHQANRVLYDNYDSATRTFKTN
mgnify:CR=1 FL=1